MEAATKPQNMDLLEVCPLFLKSWLAFILLKSAVTKVSLLNKEGEATSTTRQLTPHNRKKINGQIFS